MTTATAAVTNRTVTEGRARPQRSLEELVELRGFEPLASCLQSRRSPTELQPRPVVYKAEAE